MPHLTPLSMLEICPTADAPDGRPAHPPAALSPVHTSNNVEATLSNATMSNVASTLLLVWTGLYRPRQTTTTDDADRLQRAKQYWPIRRASNNMNRYALNIVLFFINVCRLCRLMRYAEAGCDEHGPSTRADKMTAVPTGRVYGIWFILPGVKSVTRDTGVQNDARDSRATPTNREHDHNDADRNPADVRPELDKPVRIGSPVQGGRRQRPRTERRYRRHAGVPRPPAAQHRDDHHRGRDRRTKHRQTRAALALVGRCESIISLPLCSLLLLLDCVKLYAVFAQSLMLRLTL